MKHPISKFLNPQATHLSSLIFLGAIFYAAFKRPLVLSNPIKGTPTADEIRRYQETVWNISEENQRNKLEGGDFYGDLQSIKKRMEYINEIIYDFSIDEPFINKQREAVKRLLNDAEKAYKEWEQSIPSSGDWDDSDEVLSDKVVEALDKLESNQWHLAKEVTNYVDKAFDEEINAYRFAEDDKEYESLVKKNPLKINSKMKNWTSDTEAIITMHPKDFLTLTTHDENEYWRIMEDTRGLDFYNSDEINSGMIVHPFLILDGEGVILGHEGRHRAAAVIQNGEKKFDVALILRERHKGLPNRIIAQFKGNDYFVAMPKPKWKNKYTLGE